MSTRIPPVADLYGGDPTLCTGDADAYNPNGRPKPVKLAERHDSFVKAMTASSAEGVSGGVALVPNQDTSTPIIKSRKKLQAEMRSVVDSGSNGVFTKSASDQTQEVLKSFLAGPSAAALAKEWTLLRVPA
jgi:hypothetical protein